MKPCSFDYQCAESVDHAVELLGRYGDEAKILAGGQSLVPAMNFRLAQPAVLVDVNRVDGLSQIQDLGGALRCGAMLRQRVVETAPLIASHVPLLTETMPFVAHPQIRNRGTLGGSIAHADPSAELPAVALVLQATMHARSTRGERTMPAEEFFVDLLTTALEPDELLVAIDFPKAGAGCGYAFEEVSRRHGDYALVGAAAAVECHEGICRSARVGLLSVGTGPVFATSCSEALVGSAPTSELIQAAAETAAADDIDPESDIHASSRYRRHLAKILMQRVLGRAFARAKKT